MAESGAWVLSWLATAWLHALLLLAVAWAVERFGRVTALASRELLWRCALLLPLASATLAVGVDRAALRLEPRGTVALPAAAIEAAPPRAPTVVAATGDLAQPAVASPPTPRTALPATPDRGVRTLAAALGSLLADPRWPGLLALAWLALALLAIGSAGLRLRRLRTRLAALPPPADPSLCDSARRIARAAGLDHVALAEDAALGSPVAVSPRTVGVPRWSIDRLAPAQHRAMLAHEIAHLARRDPQWRLRARAIGALLPTPLTALALRRLDDIAELQCDAWAVATTGDPRALAECLAACLAHGSARTTPEFAAPMAAAHSPLVERVRRLIEEPPMSRPAPGLLRRIAIVGVIAGAAALMPHIVFDDARAQATPPAPPEPPAAAPSPPPTPASRLKGSVSIADTWLSGRTISIDLRGDGYALEVEGEGRFRFNEGEDDLVTLDGSLEIEETQDGVTRSVRFTGDGDRIVRAFTVDGETVPDDADTRQWLARLVPALLRATGIDAKDRVARLWRKGGADAVLAEIDLIATDHVRARYLGLLFEQGALPEPALARALAAAGEIDSDYEQRGALSAALAHQVLTVDAQRTVYGFAAALDSDYERRQLLEAALPTLAKDPRAADHWIDALDSMASDYEHRVALAALVEEVALDLAQSVRLLESAGRIESDYERRVILERAAARLAAVREAAPAFARAATGIDSDYEARQALVALVEAMDPTPTNCTAVLEAMGNIDSDHEAGAVLAALAARMPADAELIERYRASARRLGGHERGQAEAALDHLFES